MERRAEIIISGRVQKASFRYFIDELAFDLNLKGYVKNLDDGTVQVICEGEEDAISELLEKININRYPVSVENISVTYKKLTGDYKAFEILWSENPVLEAYERADAFAECLWIIVRTSSGPFRKEA